MPKVLIVEDDSSWQRIHRTALERILEKSDIVVVSSYEDATSRLVVEYAAYILDGEFPRQQGQTPQRLGIGLAEEIHSRSVPYDRIIIASGNSSLLKEARALGIEKIYSKGSPNIEAGERDIQQLAKDLKPLLR